MFYEREKTHFPKHFLKAILIVNFVTDV